LILTNYLTIFNQLLIDNSHKPNRKKMTWRERSSPAQQQPMY